jgi:hypothetical protein
LKCFSKVKNNLSNFSKALLLTFAFSVFAFLSSVSDSQAAQATMSWTAPTTYTDGSAITGISGYKVYVGTSPGSYSQTVSVGNVTNYTVSNLADSTTYYFAVAAYDTTGGSSATSSPFTYKTPTPSTLYTLSASAGTGGSITPSGSVAVSQGASQTFTITPASGYSISGVTVDGTSVGAVSTYSFSNIAANHTIAASFTQNATGSNGTGTAATYSITASAGINGSISPTGATSVASGSSQSYTVTPSTGYYVVSVVVDGATVASNVPSGGYSYTFSNVTANHTISATFGVRSYNIVASAGANGAVSPANAWVVYNSAQTVAITPNTGYYVTGLTVDGVAVAPATSYTFNNVAASHTLSATFGTTPPVASYTITASAGINGSISPTGTTSLTSGSSKTYTVTPSTGYYVVSVVVDGATVASNVPSGGYSYTFSNVTGNHTISATFGVRSYNIVSTAGTNGTVSPANTWVVYNSAQTVAITPASGHKVLSVTVDGVSVGAVSSYTFNNIAAGHTLAATFQ